MFTERTKIHRPAPRVTSVLAGACLVLGACTTTEDAPAADMPDAGTPGSATPDAGAARPTMPLEVVHTCPAAPEVAPCAEVSVEVVVPSGRDLTGAALRVTAHNIVEHDSAEVIVNGRGRVALSDSASALVILHGGVGSQDFPLDAAWLTEGANELSFRYTRQVPDVSGYRVLDVALLVSGDELRPDLEVADPGTWRGYSEDASAIERGRRFFTEVSRDGGPVCAACHTDSGSDLPYFAFSNHSIVERAEHHLFSEAEARDIASYLRSLDVEPVGRPFDPPFQPGAGNHAAAGAGWQAAGDDETLGEVLFPDGPPDDPIAWDWAASIDPYSLPAPIALPGWLRWLPRRLEARWLDMRAASTGKTLAEASAIFAADRTAETATLLVDTAMSVGEALALDEGDHDARAQLARYAAVKVWEWSRAVGFDSAVRGVPDDAPAYPYEVGFAFWEAGREGIRIPKVFEQVLQWWWVQITLHAGRGLSDGQRPLDWRDVLQASEDAGLGSNAVAFLYLLGSYEESRGALEGRFGTELGPVRLLPVPMRLLPQAWLEPIAARHLRRTAEWAAGGGEITDGHRATFAEAWSTLCGRLPADAIDRLIGLAPPSLELGSCPE